MAKKAAGEAPLKPGSSSIPAIAPESVADQDDSGWESSSATAPDFLEETPADTTAKATERNVSAPADRKPVDKAKPATAAKPADADLGDEDEDAGEDDGEAHAGEAKSTEKPTRGRQQLSDRKKSLTHEIRTLTHTKHQTNAEIQRERTELARVRTELAEVNRRLGKPAGDGAAAAAPADPAKRTAKPVDVGPMPKPPKYTDFETDADYNTAVSKWDTDVAAWQTKRDGALRESITSDLDTRLDQRDSRRQAEEADRAYYDRLGERRANRKDWDEKAASLKDIRSSWHDDSDGVQAPFLSDITRYNEEDGPEALEWLMDHPEEAQILAELQPTRALRDAFIHAPSAVTLFEYFSTEEGQREWATLSQMHPPRVPIALGALSARLAAQSGPVADAPEPITAASPSSKPQAGSPRARSEPKGHRPASESGPVDKWIEDENAKETEANLRQQGFDLAKIRQSLGLPPA